MMWGLVYSLLDPPSGRVSMSHSSQSHRRSASSVIVTMLAFVLIPARRVSADDATLCDRYGTSAVTFVGVAGAPIWHRIPFPPQGAPIPLFVTPMTVERAYHGVET